MKFFAIIFGLALAMPMSPPKSPFEEAAEAIAQLKVNSHLDPNFVASHVGGADSVPARLTPVHELYQGLVNLGYTDSIISEMPRARAEDVFRNQIPALPKTHKIRAGEDLHQ